MSRKRALPPPTSHLYIVSPHAQRRPSRAPRSSFIFHKYDIDRSGGIEEGELALCFAELAVRVNGRQRKTKEEVREWVQREFKRNDKNQVQEAELRRVCRVLQHVHRAQPPLL